MSCSLDSQAFEAIKIQLLDNRPSTATDPNCASSPKDETGLCHPPSSPSIQTVYKSVASKGCVVDGDCTPSVRRSNDQAGLELPPASDSQKRHEPHLNPQSLHAISNDRVIVTDNLLQAGLDKMSARPSTRRGYGRYSQQHPTQMFDSQQFKDLQENLRVGTRVHQAPHIEGINNGDTNLDILGTISSTSGDVNATNTVVELEGSEDELSQDVQDDTFNVTSPLAPFPMTPAVTSRKRTRSGSFITPIVRTPAPDLKAAFGFKSNKKALAMSQAFNQTQAPSSSQFEGPHSDPITGRYPGDNLQFSSRRTPSRHLSPNDIHQHVRSTSDPGHESVQRYSHILRNKIGLDGAAELHSPAVDEDELGVSHERHNVSPIVSSGRRKISRPNSIASQNSPEEAMDDQYDEYTQDVIPSDRNNGEDSDDAETSSRRVLQMVTPAGTRDPTYPSFAASYPRYSYASPRKYNDGRQVSGAEGSQQMVIAESQPNGAPVLPPRPHLSPYSQDFISQSLGQSLSSQTKRDLHDDEGLPSELNTSSIPRAPPDSAHDQDSDVDVKSPRSTPPQELLREISRDSQLSLEPTARDDARNHLVQDSQNDQLSRRDGGAVVQDTTLGPGSRVASRMRGIVASDNVPETSPAEMGQVDSHSREGPRSQSKKLNVEGRRNGDVHAAAIDKSQPHSPPGNSQRSRRENNTQSSTSSRRSNRAAKLHSTSDGTSQLDISPPRPIEKITNLLSTQDSDFEAVIRRLDRADRTLRSKRPRLVHEDSNENGVADADSNSQHSHDQAPAPVATGQFAQHTRVQPKRLRTSLRNGSSTDANHSPLPAESHLAATNEHEGNLFDDRNGREANFGVVEESRPTSASNEIIAPDRVLARFSTGNLDFYPATCIGIKDERNGVCLVRFDDDTTVELEKKHIRILDLRLGDHVRVLHPNVPKGVYVIRGFKDRVSAEVLSRQHAPHTDIHGNRTLILDSRKRASLPYTAQEDRSVEVEVTNIYVTSAMLTPYTDRLYQYDDASKSGYANKPRETPAILSAPPTPPSRGRRKTTTKAPILAPSFMSTPTTKTGVFANMIFAISYSADNDVEKSAILALLVDNGGEILLSGFEELFDLPEPEITKSTAQNGLTTGSNLVLRDQAKALGFVAVIADTHSRRAKFMQALALNIPCLSGRWIRDCVSKNKVVSWELYLLPAGESTFLNDAIRSRTLVTSSRSFEDASDAHLQDIIQQRRLLLSGKNIILVMGKGKVEEKLHAHYFLLLALGARRVNRVTDIAAAKSLLSKGEVPWDLVYVEDGKVKEARKQLASKSSTGRSGRNSKLDAAALPSLDCEVVGDSMVVQSLILGAVVENDVA